MRKLKNEIFSKLHNEHLTGTDISVFLEIAMYQDDYGNVQGVYYKDITELLGISNQTYYNSLERLSEAGLISVEKNNYFDRDIKILNNSFNKATYKKNNTEGYVSLSAELYSSESFRKLRAGAKLLAMHCILFYQRNSRTYQIATDKFIDKYTRLLNVTRRVIISYLKDLKKFFSIGIKDGKYFITPLAAYSDTYGSSDNELYYEHELKAALRREKASATPETKTNIIRILVTQYSKKIKEHNSKSFNSSLDICSIIKQCFTLKNKNKKKKSEWNMELSEKLFHQQLKKALSI